MPRRNGIKRKYRRRRTIRTKRFAKRVVTAVARAAEKKLAAIGMGTWTAPFMLTNNPYVYFNPIEGVTQGTTRGTRIGNRIYIRRSKLRFCVSFNFGSANPTGLNVGYRIIIGYFKNWNYINNDIFEATGATNSDRFLAPIDIDKFWVKKDKVYSLWNQWGLNPNVPAYRMHKISIKWNKSIMFNDNLATASSQSIFPAILLLSNTYTNIGGGVTQNPNNFALMGGMVTSFTDL